EEHTSLLFWHPLCYRLLIQLSWGGSASGIHSNAKALHGPHPGYYTGKFGLKYGASLCGAYCQDLHCNLLTCYRAPVLRIS
ncbi:hypothetical protein BKA61DRAFT_617829, partial [Leptodontidium sp. MPI-SDFR-AT-0119]